MKLIHVVRLVILSALLALPLMADLAIEGRYQHSAKALAAILKSQHVSKISLNDEMSERAFELFFNKLDEKRIFFLASDLKDFGKYRKSIDDTLPKGDLEFPAEVLRRYRLRAKELLTLAKQILDEAVDFTIDEEIDLDFERLSFPSTPEVRRDRLRKDIKYFLLEAKLATPSEPQEEHRKRALEAYEKVVREVETIAEFDFLERYLTAVGNSYDPHSDFLSPNSESQFRAQMSQKLFGVGLALDSDTAGKTKVMELKSGGPAALDGRLKVGDIIVGITADTTNNEYLDFSGIGLKTRVNLIRGKANTKISLRIFRESEKTSFEVELTRAEIKLDATSAVGTVKELHSGDRKLRVGMIVLPEFYEDHEACRVNEFTCKSASNDVATLLNSDEFQNINLLFFDLRNNPGGSLRTANRTVGHFIDLGPTVQVKGHAVRKLGDNIKGQLYAGPLVVIVNQLSASASEIFAAAIQDYRRGIVVGGNTFGKGSVQSVVPLSDPIQRIFFGAPEAAGLAKVSVDMYYRVTGKSTQKVGVNPDVELPFTSVIKLEAEYPNVLEHSTIDPMKFTPANSVNAETLNDLKTRSGNRVEKSDDFKRYRLTIENRKARAAVKTKSLNEARRLAIEKEPKDKTEIRGIPELVVLVPPRGADPTQGALTPDNFYNQEILQIGLDLESVTRAAAE